MAGGRREDQPALDLFRSVSEGEASARVVQHGRPVSSAAETEQRSLFDVDGLLMNRYGRLAMEQWSRYMPALSLDEQEKVDRLTRLLALVQVPAALWWRCQVAW